MTCIKIKNITKKFKDFTALNSISFEVKSGEFFTLLGPSGCGKTTLMRIIAGLIEPESGQIFFGEEEVTKTPAQDRKVGLFFQNYALWPHLNVSENVGFGLKLRKVPDAEITKRVKEILEIVGLKGVEGRKINQLSGGQQQRVALARCLVIKPHILLLDEPLSNLDAKLRTQTRAELKNIQEELKITTVYVTHDQEEALTLSDRICVLDKGIIQQIGTPMEIYENPLNKFVADFIGTANFFDNAVVIKIDSKKGTAGVELKSGEYLTTRLDRKISLNSKVTVFVRPEDMEISPLRRATARKPNVIEGKVKNVFYAGDASKIEVLTRDENILKIDTEPEQAVACKSCEKVSVKINQSSIITAS